MKLAPAFHPHFHWINDTDIISDFRKVKPWTNIVRILEGTALSTSSILGGICALILFSTLQTSFLTPFLT